MNPTALLPLRSRAALCIVDDIDLVEAHDAALVLGAGVLVDGRPSAMLFHRVVTASELFRRGAVKRLLLSGDGAGSRGHDEVAVMAALAIEHGVAAESLLEDREGLSTHASCMRAVDRFGLCDVVIVTQRFHARRAHYLAQHVGLTGQTLALPDVAIYGWRVVAPLVARECLAGVKAVIDAR